jgi:small subunit ribosomal protein S17
MDEKSIKKSREFVGVVLSDKMDKTIVVRVDRMKLAKKYEKSARVTSKYHVHDPKEIAKVGDKVVFVEGRPYSKTKRWFLKEIIK